MGTGGAWEASGGSAARESRGGTHLALLCPFQSAVEKAEA